MNVYHQRDLARDSCADPEPLQLPPAGPPHPHRTLATSPVSAALQATVHRTWVVDESTRRRYRSAEPSAKLLTPTDPGVPPQEYTTIAREMERVGASRLNVLKVR